MLWWCSVEMVIMRCGEWWCSVEMVIMRCGECCGDGDGGIGYGALVLQICILVHCIWTCCLSVFMFLCVLCVV